MASSRPVVRWYNAHAQGFYELLGISPNASKLFYRLEGTGLREALDS
jgi:hypothetical protein